ncbi:UbiA family prenyltransferase [Nonomuraea sp. NPDC050790]|uniref:UbiA family prenyltransferase n=1 Tax=Nonomuraea sp. NPDC050790 TaxID=3364371 RepID=UPI0037B1E405
MLAMCVAEARPAVLTVSALRFLTGVVLALPVVEVAPEPLKVLQGAAAWVLSIFAIYLFNGVTDVTEDRVNGSARPIARGALDPGSALFVAGVAAVLSLAATLDLPGPMTLIVGANLVLGYLYSGPPLPLKGSSGGTVVVLVLSGLLSYLGGFTLAAGGQAVATPTGLLVFAAASIAWMTLVGVPAKDLSDLEGDAAAGRRTIVVTRGERASRWFMSVAASGLVVALFAVILLLGVELVWVALAVAAGAVAVVRAGGRALPPGGSRSEQRRPYRAFMATQHLVHITALISGI